MYYKYIIVHNSNISKLKNILRNTSKDGLGYCTLANFVSTQNYFSYIIIMIQFKFNKMNIAIIYT